MNDAGAEGALDPVKSPHALARRDVAAAAGPDSDGGATADTAAHGHEFAFAPKRRCVNRATETLAEPELLASFRVQRREPKW